MKKIVLLFVLLSQICWSQHHSKMKMEVDSEKKTLTIVQELTYLNNTSDTLTSISLNDWINGYTSKKTPMAARFSDEFERSFHLAKDKDRGRTENFIIKDNNANELIWERDKNHPDVINVNLNEKLLPSQQKKILISYLIKIPNDKFTRFGFDNTGKLYLKNFFLTPARYENHGFIKYDNLNLDDAANAQSDFDLEITLNKNLSLFTDLNELKQESQQQTKTYFLSGKKRLEFSLSIDLKKDFSIYKNKEVEVVSNLDDKHLSDIQKALAIDKITLFVSEKLGAFPHEKIMVSQVDYDRNPFYGINQLPSYISPFPDDFLYEIKFLKTYLNNFLQNTLQLDHRKDNWIFDGIQNYLMIKYIEENYPDSKMMGKVAKLKLLKGFNLVSLDFNSQYSYFYLLMARKNLDQPLSTPKDALIKFNEKIASKYRAGLSFNYLDSYLENQIVPKSIQQFIALNQQKQTTAKDFETLLTTNSPKKINWFFDKIIYSRDIIDIKFEEVTHTNETVYFKQKNKNDINIPVPVYGINKKNIVFKQWFENAKKDTIYTLLRKNAERIALNYKNEIPEFNLRNNWHSLKKNHLFNKPIKFSFMKDLEDPNYNQIIYFPTFDFNLYDGVLAGIRVNNRTILDKPFNYDLNPMFATKTKNLGGKFFLFYNQYNRDSNLYAVKYQLAGHHLHYAPDAFYTKITPSISLLFRPDDYRDNEKSMLIFKEIIINRQNTNYIVTDNIINYEVFNIKYIKSKTEVTHHFNTLYDFQLSKTFGKIAAEFQFRNLYNNNRQLNIRMFAGGFYFNNTTTNYFDFGLDRPSDYLFESDYVGRSEGTGIFSQQSIVADGFFKSKLDTRTANQWMATTNASYTIWNWVEVYSDIGMLQNRGINPMFVYDSGIRLNFLTDFFELYFPIYSNNGWEIAQNNYGQKFRFIATFNPQTLINLFTRKWF